MSTTCKPRRSGFRQLPQAAQGMDKPLPRFFTLRQPDPEFALRYFRVDRPDLVTRVMADGTEEPVPGCTLRSCETSKEILVEVGGVK